MIALAEARYTSRQAAAALGLPHRKLDRVVRRLGFEPTIGSVGSGRKRGWSLLDILAVRVGHDWLRQGVPWLVARQIVRRIQDAGWDLLKSAPVLILPEGRASAAPAEHCPVDAAPVQTYDLRPRLADIRQRIKEWRQANSPLTNQVP